MSFTFDLRTIPFSRYGSFLTISFLKLFTEQPEGLYLRTVRGGDESSGAAFRIELVHDDETVSFVTEATPTRLRLVAQAGYADFCISDAFTLRCRSQGVGVRLSLSGGHYDYAMQRDPDRWEVNSFLNEVRFMLTAREGRLRMDAPWARTRCTYVDSTFIPDIETHYTEFTVDEYRVSPKKQKGNETFIQAEERLAAEYAAWYENTLPVPSLFVKGRELASYITWSAVVPQGGYLTRPAMYMSKNWMTNIWSWDHCFNAMALIRTNPELAWDQFMIFFDRQDESGLIPDFINDKYELWNCNKPPIHGWTLMWMMERSDWIDDGQLREVYEPLARWTRWWYNDRDDDHDGVPQYNHGNDSGWDNSTVFSERGAVESPDLCAYLILQCEALARIAERLNRPFESGEWKALAQLTLDRLLQHFWQDGRMRALRSGTHEQLTEGSLIVLMPIIVGHRLPHEVLEWLVQELSDESKFFTSNGFATESLSSSCYESDGYWRGPIWAPVMMLLVDGLARSGYEQLANEAAMRFCRMATVNGMAENFDAVTGEGLRDRAFTWTSSVYLILANEYISPTY